MHMCVRVFAITSRNPPNIFACLYSIYQIYSTTAAAMADTSNDGKMPVQSRKERRFQWWSKQQQALGVTDSTTTESSTQRKSLNLESVDALPPEKKVKKPSDSAKKFYVLFVGQIPYKASQDDVVKHFSKAGNVKSVRLATHKDSGKSRGFGYVEFKDSKSYMNGLGMHLSKINGRPVNVEITSPGRGTSVFRKESLKRKNAEMARFRCIKEDGTSATTGGALRIPHKHVPKGKKKTFTDDTNS